MFKNIGSKIKTLSKVVCWLGIIVSILIGLIFIVASVMSGNGMVYGIIIGLICIVGGSIASWIGSFFTYGFGEIIDKLTEIANNTKK
ncbi:MAG: hypothetical protein PUF84_02355 [Ruminococcus bromii]|nr:hypothetical protein [Ruminococcus bromii]MDD6433444.1 hypothetical protein [Ruminococcus bromii]MDY4712141.1 hypothetical protein [Ruminococcus bromii]